ncbi:MAG: hypothetical protein H6Q64_726 [Firmicutes bacterium]|nr:hypothetical protein [Bacillota bacterium]
MEKIKAFFQNQSVRKFNAKVFNKKTLIGAIVIIVIVAALKIAFSLLFQIEGTVQKVDGSKITVANILTTKTIDAGQYPISNLGVQAGDRIEITKNLQGQVISIRDENRERLYEKGNVDFHDGGCPGMNNNHDFREKR